MRSSVLLLGFILLASPLLGDDVVTLVHFSDYHSHALPFYTEGGERGGIARAIGYMKQQKQRGALVFSGGDMMNKGAPSWSDRYQCAEWSWLNGVVDAMALGNHELDYGEAAFEKCRWSVRYPILSHNTLGFEGFRIFTTRGRRIGVFAVAGPDFPKLVRDIPLQFSDPVAAARDAVKRLRASGVDAVVMIGHQQTEDDYAIARAVPGIDLIFGTHAHVTRELTQIPGTRTSFIASGQYLEAVSRVELHFGGGGSLRLAGQVLPVDGAMRAPRRLERRVARMQRALEKDPAWAPFFRTLTTLEAPIGLEALAGLTLRVMREISAADVALSTRSSFRRPLGAGPLTLEALRGALPYDNEVLVCSMKGAVLQGILDQGVARSGSDSELVIDGKVTVDPEATYRVAAVDYLARVAYRDRFHCPLEPTGRKIRDELARHLAAGGS